MQHMQHLCGGLIDVDFFESHGEIILDMVDVETGEQINDRCPECGEEIFNDRLFPLDIFPQMQVLEEMAVAVLMEV